MAGPAEHPDTKIMKGSPQDTPMEPEPNPDPGHNPDPSPEPSPPADPLIDIRARLERAEKRADDLARLIPPATPKATPEIEPTEPEIDWEKELFANPKATLEKFGKHIEARVEKKLRTEYQRDRGTQDFWAEFYHRHPDLRQDSDLVQLVLNSNLSDLSNIPVREAYDRLAELTRERILRYAGGAARKPAGRKAQAEAAGKTPSAASAVPAAPEKAEVTSLSDVLRSRRRIRRGQLGAA